MLPLCYHLKNGKMGIFESAIDYGKHFSVTKNCTQKSLCEHYAHNRNFRKNTKNKVFSIFFNFQISIWKISKKGIQFSKSEKNACEHHAHKTKIRRYSFVTENVFHSQFLFSNFDEERVANTKNEKCN